MPGTQFWAGHVFFCDFCCRGHVFIFLMVVVSNFGLEFLAKVFDLRCGKDHVFRSWMRS